MEVTDPLSGPPTFLEGYATGTAGPELVLEALEDVVELLDQARGWRRTREFFWARRRDSWASRIGVARVVLNERCEEIRAARA